MEPGHPVALPRDDVCPYAPRRVSGGDVAGDGARARLYRSLYGFRGAVEEAMLQHPDTSISLLEGRREPSGTPAANVHGVEIHSGDILVSRGGYPTSALIARGNDSRGNFSHVGLVYVDGVSHAASVIEAYRPGAAHRGPVAATPGGVACARARAVRTHCVWLRHRVHGP